MTTRFIAYIPEPTKERHSSKPLCKNMPNGFSTFYNSQPIYRNLVPIRLSAVDAAALAPAPGGARDHLTSVSCI
jgi:hypothetical protein